MRLGWAGGCVRKAPRCTFRRLHCLRCVHCLHRRLEVRREHGHTERMGTLKLAFSSAPAADGGLQEPVNPGNLAAGQRWPCWVSGRQLGWSGRDGHVRTSADVAQNKSPPRRIQRNAKCVRFEGACALKLARVRPDAL